jgi:alkylhydroperoxidase/carboxymuconolactone decarboxylase family protein YurZ
MARAAEPTGPDHSSRRFPRRTSAKAVRSGLTETELKEAIIHLAFYAGWPRAMSAIQVAKAVFAD